MYSYNRLFIGIPLSQNKRNISKESFKIVEEIRDLVEESDLEIKRISVFEENAEDLSDWMKTFLKNIKDFREKRNNEDAFDLFEEYDLDFHKNYSGSGDAPVIFGFYIDNIYKISSFDVTEFNIDILKINLLKDRFSRLAYYLLGDEVWNQLKKDNLIGVFFNNHTS